LSRLEEFTLANLGEVGRNGDVSRTVCRTPRKEGREARKLSGSVFPKDGVALLPAFPHAVKEFKGVR